MAGLKSDVKHIYLKITGKYKFLRKEMRCKSVWYGNNYGGFYVNPELINQDSIIYSFGIGEDISLDTEIIKRHNCHVWGFDPTPKSIDWIHNQALPQNFRFFPYGIGGKSGFVDFYLPKNTDHVSGSLLISKNLNKENKIRVAVKSLSEIMTDLGHSKIDLLKMDIEGAEYDVIENILTHHISIKQFLLEFHDGFYEDGLARTKKAVASLKRNGYKVFGVSNSFHEVSFIQSGRA